MSLNIKLLIINVNGFFWPGGDWGWLVDDEVLEDSVGTGLSEVELG